MQTKTLLVVFCTIVLFLISANDTAPTKPKTEVAVKPEKPIKVAGGRTEWKTKLDSRSKKLFNDYKKIIVKKIKETHKVPTAFDPKPLKYATQIVSGIRYHYLVKLPVNKFAYVTIVNQSWKKDEYGKEEHVQVRPDLYELNDKNIA